MKQIELQGPGPGLARTGIFSLLVLVLLAAAIVWFLGSTNPVTPAGYVGYLTQGAVLGKTHFVGTQIGPTSPGRTWLLSVVNVSITPYTYNEEFAGPNAVLSKDNLKISFAVHIVWKVNRERVKDFVERFSTIYGSADRSDEIVKDAYQNYLREPLRTYARDEVQQLEGLKVKDDITPIGQRIHDRILKMTTDTPFEVSSIVVGNIQYPEQVSDAVAKKLAATQELERKTTEIAIAEKAKDIRIIEANAIASSMDVINQKLTPAYIQHEAVEAQKAMVGSPNHSTIYIPVGPMGVPIVNTIDTQKVDLPKQ